MVNIRTEEIRRLVSAAANMCGHRDLHRVKVSLVSVLGQIDEIESKRSSKKKIKVAETPKFSNPRGALEEIERMIGSEMEKTKKNMPDELMNG